MSAAKPFHPALVLPVLVVTALLLHAPVLGLSFFSDDFSVIHRVGVRGDLGTGSFFRPLPDWTLHLNYRLTGPSPIGFRTINVLLLGINAWLVYRLGRNLFPDNTAPRWSTAIAAALLFVCYPFHNEPQLWIIGRGAALAASFTLLAFVIATGSSRTITKCVLVGLCTALGTMCYESALLLPLLLMAFMPIVPMKERGVWWVLPVVAFAVAGANLALRSLLTGHVANAYGASFFTHGITSYAMMTAKVFGRLFLPPEPDARAQIIRFALLMIVLAAISFIILRRTTNDRAHRRLFLVLVMLVILSCGTGIIGGVSTRTSESDRFLYLPSAFLCLLLAAGVASIASGRTRLAIVAGLCIASVLAMRRNHANWTIASRAIERIVQRVPSPPVNGRLFVQGLPGDQDGAFIFRHGFHEALLFAGRDTGRILRADTIWHVQANGSSFAALANEAPGDTLHIRASDRLVRWNGAAFEEMGQPFSPPPHHP